MANYAALWRSAPPSKRAAIPEPHPGAGIGARHEPGNGGRVRLFGQVDPAHDQSGRVDLAALKEKLGGDVAALMLTNPNTCGLFETEIIEIAEAVHGAGAFFYCDGANFNAIVGRVLPAELGIDALHINLHKTFSTPHGGGGPGSGPVVLAAELAPYAPLPWVMHGEDGFRLIEHPAGGGGDDRPAKGVSRPDGHVRAGAFLHDEPRRGRAAPGRRGRRAQRQLSSREIADVMSLSFPGICMHEVLFDDRFLKDTGVTTLDFAKALIDEGYHPMTMYFPLVVHGALLIEPTETESRECSTSLPKCCAASPSGRSQFASGSGRRRLFPRRAPA